jgi:hypothetical protein
MAQSFLNNEGINLTIVNKPFNETKTLDPNEGFDRRSSLC